MVFSGGVRLLGRFHRPSSVFGRPLWHAFGPLAHELGPQEWIEKNDHRLDSEAGLGPEPLSDRLKLFAAARQG